MNHKFRLFPLVALAVVASSFAAAVSNQPDPAQPEVLSEDPTGDEVEEPQQTSPLAPTFRPLAPGLTTPLDAGMMDYKPETLGQPIQPVLGQAPADSAVESSAAADLEGDAQEKIELWRIRPIFGVVATFDDNIFISNTNRVSDVIFSLSAGLSFEIGDYRNLEDSYLIAKYIGTGLIYLENSAENAYNQLAALEGRYVWTNLAAELSSRYEYLSTPDRDIGGLVRRSVLANSLRLIYDYSDKTSFDAEVTQSATVYVDDLDSYDYSAKLGGQYLITEKLALGAEGVLGLLDVQDSPSQYYQQFRLRAAYDATGKLVFMLSAGVETRQLADGSDFQVNPVFSLGGEYQPFASTRISFEAYRRVEGSANQIGQDYYATGFVISVQQQLFQKVLAAVDFGYENDSYFATDNQSGVNREDNYAFIRPKLSLTFFTNYKASIFYEFRRNDSNEEIYTFYDNRAGIELAAEF